MPSDARSAADRLFRHEAGRLTSALVRILGVSNIDLAEDIVQDVLCRALETWKVSGAPDNPAAWLTRAARNRAIDAIRKERTARRFAPDLEQLLSSEWSLASTIHELFEEHEIRDDQLRMMFACCNPRIDPDAQVALVLQTLSGFGASEIAQAFLVTRAAMEKRLARAKDALRQGENLLDLGGAAQIRERLDAVQRVLYLLFNEGYHSTHPDAAVRDDLVREALRLSLLLTSHPVAGTASSFALSALFCFNAARLPGRLDGEGRYLLLEQQDRSSWDRELIAHGLDLLQRSDPGQARAGGQLSEYHLQAALAAEHCIAPDFARTNWEHIVALYDALLILKPSPIVALNRAIAVGRLEGPERGLEALEAIEGKSRLAAYPFLLAAEGDLLDRAGRRQDAAQKYAAAAAQARSAVEREFFERRAAECGVGGRFS